ncbi:MAG: hypothetical protein J5510_08425 [Prevotella sp.]|nr:hypothetical protein [Prevotella sp.]
MSKFKVGDKIRLKGLMFGFNIHKHLNAVGEVVELRKYCRRANRNADTHYVIKWDCYKIPHTYMIGVVDEECELLETKKEE